MIARFRGPIYVFFFALFPIISLLSANINELALISGLRAGIFSLALAGVLLLVLGLLTRQWHRAALVISLVLLFFFSYGYLYIYFLRLTGIEDTDSLYKISSATAVTFLAGVVLFVWFRVQRPERFTPNLNIISFVMLILPSFILISDFVGRRNSNDPPTSDLTIPEAAYSTSNRPDIYYIVLDGYARADVLAGIFDFDNRPFIEDLEGRGFFVAPNSHTNYFSTVASLASSLNLQYLEDMPADENPGASNLPTFRKMVQNNQVQQIMDSLGYDTITIASGYVNTEARFADHYLSPSFRGINAFETLVLQYTPIGRYFVRPGFLLKNGLQFEPHRNRVLFSFDTLSETVPNMDSPKYVFAHILTPHPPFVFGPEGESTQPDYPYTLGDGTDYPGSREEYIGGYRNQITYINKLVLEAVDEILRQSQSPPIIIIQSDHGSGAYLQWNNAEANSCLMERGANFVAVLAPEAEALFYDTITPVNIFRLLFNDTFDMGFEPLEDKTYFVRWDSLRNFTDITAEIESSNACLTGAFPAQ